MRSLSKLCVLGLIACLAACASKNETATRNYRYVGQDASCSDTLIKESRPADQVKYVQAPTTPGCSGCQAQAAQSCGGCQAREYTVRTPVKVVYKNTTYRTVYEPRTYQTTAYEARPYNRAEACTDGNCVANQPVVAAQPVTVMNAPQVEAEVDDVVYEK